MKTLTVIAFTTVPVSIALQFIGPRSAEVSFFKNINDGSFFIILGSAGFIGLLMYIYFRYRKWL